jgi:TolB protein
MDANGTNQTLLDQSSANDVHPDWSPDGKSIVFAVNNPPFDDDNYDIYVMDSEGKKRTRLTDNSATDWYPAWSPDGKRIAFTTDRDKTWQVYIMSADGENWTRLADSAEDGPAWSPDGKQIAYEYLSEIYVINDDDTNQVRLTDTSGRNMSPAW